MFKKGVIIAHRGIYDNIKIFENTIESFNLAIQKKYIIELDVHLTKDKQLVVFHDYDTKRLLSKNMIVRESSYHELNKASKFHIPLLAEVLKIINNKVPILIEIKHENKIGILEQELMNILKKYNGEYYIQSFNPLTLWWLKKNYPNIITGQLSCCFGKKDYNPLKKYILKKMLLNPFSKPDFISYKYNELSQKEIKKIKKKNITLLGWTVTSKEEYDKYIKLYDNLICEKFI